MAEIIDHMAERTNALVVLISHVTNRARNDDKVVHEEIYEKVKSKYNVRLIEGDYTTNELKGIIGVCDMFIGCRMHSTIASTSMSVPTIAIVYGHKSHGVLGDVMGQGKYIIEI